MEGWFPSMEECLLVSRDHAEVEEALEGHQIAEIQAQMMTPVYIRSTFTRLYG
jgi:hypothetical protein